MTSQRGIALDRNHSVMWPESLAMSGRGPESNHELTKVYRVLRYCRRKARFVLGDATG